MNILIESSQEDKPTMKTHTAHNLIHIGEHDVARMSKLIDDEVDRLEAAGEDNPDNERYAALGHIASVFDAESTVKLSQRQFMRTVAVEQDGFPVAAGFMTFSRDKKRAEIHNVGSIDKGAGTAIMHALIADAKAVGVRNITLTSTAKEFYGKFGFKDNGGSTMSLQITNK